MKLKKIKLNALSEAGLKDKAMGVLKGGTCCTCSCYWEGKPGGSSSMDNMTANHDSPGGAESKHGCNQYGWCGDGIEGMYSDYDAHA